MDFYHPIDSIITDLYVEIMGKESEEFLFQQSELFYDVIRIITIIESSKNSSFLLKKS